MRFVVRCILPLCIHSVLSVLQLPSAGQPQVPPSADKRKPLILHSAAYIDKVLIQQAAGSLEPVERHPGLCDHIPGRSTRCQ